MTKELEALERIGKNKYQTTVANITGFERITISVKQDNKKDYQIIEKALKDKEKKDKALEIIRKKLVNVYDLLNSHTLEEYNLHNCQLTQEDYDLLKEVLDL